MQFVDFTRTARLLEPEHPLLGDDVNFQRMGGWAIGVQYLDSGPPEKEHEQKESRDGPADFDLVFEDIRQLAARRRRAAPVADHEDDDESDQENDDDGGERGENPESFVNPHGIAGGFGIELIDIHGAAALVIRCMTRMPPPMSSTVKAQAASSNRLMRAV